MIYLNEPNIKRNSIKYINDCLKTNWVSTSGQYIDKFKQGIKEVTNSKFVTLTNSGTSALHLALKIAGVTKNTEVICPSMTFIAPINAILYCGGSPIFFDCDKNYNLNTKDVINFLNTKTIFKNNKTYNIKTDKIIKAIVIVHMWGNVCEFDQLKKVCRKKNLKIIEDASESLGSYFYKSYKKIHTGTIGDIGCISFNGNKIITTGSGGAILTNNNKFIKIAEYLASQAKDDNIRFIHNDVGYNYRMTNLNAALGLSQLENLENFIEKKIKIRSYYEKGLIKKEGIKLIEYPNIHKNNFWLNVVYFDKKIKKSIYEIYLHMLKNKIETRMVWFPVHLQNKMKKFERYNLKNTKKYFERSLCLPSGTSLTKKKIDRVIGVLCKI